VLYMLMCNNMLLESLDCRGPAAERPMLTPAGATTASGFSAQPSTAVPDVKRELTHPNGSYKGPSTPEATEGDS
jgi:hypothetical protein